MELRGFKCKKFTIFSISLYLNVIYSIIKIIDNNSQKTQSTSQQDKRHEKSPH